MSHYRKINVDIKNGESLVQALRDLGMTPQVSSDLRQNSMTLFTHWRSFGAIDQRVAVAVQRDDLREAKSRLGYGVGYAMDGIGFAWNGSGYDMIQDGLPETAINSIRQRYAVVEAKRLAMVEGYTVTEQQDADGTVRLVCNKFSPVGEYGGY